MSTWAAGGLAALALVWPGRESSAGAEAALVLEVHERARPPDAARLLEPAVRSLGAAGFVTGQRAARLIEARVSRPASARRNQPAARLLATAAAELRRGRAVEAERAMAELMRRFPEAEPSRREHGGDMVALYRELRRRVAQAGSGHLVVEVSEPRAAVFVDDGFRGVGRVEATLPAGLHRVQARVGKEDGRSRDVVVTAGRTTRLVVPWALDRALRTGPDWAALVVDRDRGLVDRDRGVVDRDRGLVDRDRGVVDRDRGLVDRDRGVVDRDRGLVDRDRGVVDRDRGLVDRDRGLVESAAAPAAAVARAVGAGEVVLLALERRGTRRILVGAVVAASGRVLRRASARVDRSGDRAGVVALAGFLARGGRPHQPDVAARPPRRGRWQKWALATTSLVALGSGAALIRADGTCKERVRGRPCWVAWNTAPAGWTALGLGAALGAASAYSFWRDARPPDEHRLLFAVTPRPGGLAASVDFAF